MATFSSPSSSSGIGSYTSTSGSEPDLTSVKSPLVGRVPDYIELIPGEKPYQCIYCLRIFGTKESVRNHATCQPGNSMKCPQCPDKYFKTKYLLDKHMRAVHSQGKVHVCSVSGCKKNFPTKTELTRHMLTHTKEKKFACQNCESRFQSKQSLENHQKRKHTLEKRFPCSICTNHFFDKQTLHLHLVNDHRDSEAAKQLESQRIVTCSDCKKVLTKKRLETHKCRQAHSKTPKCKKCSKTFSDMGCLRRHLKTVHVPKEHFKFKCSHCEYTSPRKENFNRHWSSFHQTSVAASSKTSLSSDAQVDGQVVPATPVVHEIDFFSLSSDAKVNGQVVPATPVVHEIETFSLSSDGQVNGQVVPATSVVHEIETFSLSSDGQVNGQVVPATSVVHEIEGMQEVNPQDCMLPQTLAPTWQTSLGAHTTSAATPAPVVSNEEQSFSDGSSDQWYPVEVDWAMDSGFAFAKPFWTVKY